LDVEDTCLTLQAFIGEGGGGGGTGGRFVFGLFGLFIDGDGAGIGERVLFDFLLSF